MASDDAMKRARVLVARHQVAPCPAFVDGEPHAIGCFSCAYSMMEMETIATLLDAVRAEEREKAIKHKTCEFSRAGGNPPCGGCCDCIVEQHDHVVRKAVAEERERCAVVCDDAANKQRGDVDVWMAAAVLGTARECAAAIRRQP